MQYSHDITIEVTDAAHGSNVAHTRGISKPRGLSSEAVQILCHWFWEHKEYPYAKGQIRLDLLEQVQRVDKKATARQMDNWLNNARQRGHRSCCSGIQPFTTRSITYQSNDGSLDAAAAARGIDANLNDSDNRSRSSSSASFHTAYESCPQAVYQRPPKQGRERLCPPTHSRSASRNSEKDFVESGRFSSSSSVCDASFVDALQYFHSATDMLPSDVQDMGFHGPKLGIYQGLCDSPEDSMSPVQASNAIPLLLPQAWEQNVGYQHEAYPFGPQLDDQLPYSPDAINASIVGSSAGVHHESAQDVREIWKSVESKAVQFQCTFCLSTELTEKTWKRHEERHVPQREYVCMPNDRPYLDGHDICVFCGASGHSHSILCEDKHARCVRRARQQRTFDRKDKLVQHIDAYHKTAVDDAVLKAWETILPGAQIRFVCGFCGEENMLWDDRASHISRHFRDRLDMTSWRFNGASDADHS